MKKINLLSLVLIALFLISQLSAADKDYSIERVLIEAELEADGSMRVTETRTFSFQGSFTYLYRSFPKNGPVTFTDFKVKEGAIGFKESRSRESGTILLEEDANNINLTWYITARNETRTFQLSYNVINAVKNYNDAAVLYYQFISPDWNKPQFDVMITVKSPEILNRYEIQHWLHGPFTAESRLEYDGSITATCDKLPRRSYLELRAIYPISAFAAAPRIDAFVKADIQAQEAIWADEANALREAWQRQQIRKQKMNDTGRWLIPLLSAILLLFSLHLFNKYGRRPEVERHSYLVTEPPENIPPALVGYLMNSRTVSGPSLIATIMDLARKGFLNLKQEESEKRPGKYKQNYFLKLKREKYDEERSSLLEYEIKLLDFLFEEIGAEDDLLEIKQLKKHRNKFMRFFTKWKKSLSETGKSRDWFDITSIRVGYIAIAVNLFFTVLAGVAVIWFGLQTLVFLGVSLVCLIIAAFIPHHSYNGRISYLQWKAFRNYLRKNKYTTETEEKLLNKINDLFVFGTLFDIGKKNFRRLGSMIPETEHQRYVPWYILHSSRGQTFSPAAFGDAMATMISTAGTTMSSASGAGGGASGGGGGGAGSGGGGAG